MRIDCQRLEELLGVPVVPTVATSGKGMKTLVERINSLPAERPQWRRR